MIAGPANQTGELRTRGVVLKRGCFPLAANAGGVRQDPATQMESGVGATAIVEEGNSEGGLYSHCGETDPRNGQMFCGS